MALNIKNPQVERLAADVAALTGESKTEAIRKALEERKSRLGLGSVQGERERWLEFLERDVWPTIPSEQLGRTLTHEEEDDILGYGPEGI